MSAHLFSQLSSKRSEDYSRSKFNEQFSGSQLDTIVSLLNSRSLIMILLSAESHAHFEKDVQNKGVRPDQQVLDNNHLKVNLASSDFHDYADEFALLYLLCQEQLSEQNNYNWGLRDILSVLLFSKEVRAPSPTMNETVLIDCILITMNLSKLVNDEERFKGKPETR